DMPIAWLETEELERDVEKYRVDLELARKRLAKAEENARLQNHLNALSVQESQSNYEYRQNQLASAQSTLEKTQRLVDAGISPRKALEDAELNVLSQELQMQNAKLALEKSINNRDSQAELQKADVTAARIDVEKSEAELEQVQENLSNAVIRAPTSGMVLYKMVWKGGGIEKVAVGDQVGPWHPFLEIPDLSELEVVTQVDEIDISRLAEGQSAAITLDAFPDMRLTGRVTKIAALAQDAEGPGESIGGGSSNASGRKVFEVHISIDDAPSELRPGVTGRVRILLAEEPDALVVPIESVFSDSDGQFVYVDTFNGPDRRDVETGVWNHQYITIARGLDAGDKVWLVRPE
ncbi:MAG TPA: efflux RND transporter periplasmic adaptor subunit, partial [bacterium]|nr:efflux RND transporter periplasmic adaptor subunit [bacterium]